jgi:phosphatidylserine decarboxylase
VDRIVVGNKVTASQAHRKWYTKVNSMVSSGDYKLGAVNVPYCLLFSLLKYPLYIQNSANIIVQNRITGHLEEEKMQVYVRLGIRLLYKGTASRMEGGRGRLFSVVLLSTVDPFIARRLLKSLSIKQGIKHYAPESTHDIAPFIAFHELNLDEILDPTDSFCTLVNIFSTATSNNI